MCESMSVMRVEMLDIAAVRELADNLADFSAITFQIHCWSLLGTPTENERLG